jgi:hypothetical protein
VLNDPTTSRRLTMAGRRLVDGRGAFRVAAWLRRLPAVAAAHSTHVA